MGNCRTVLGQASRKQAAEQVAFEAHRALIPIDEQEPCAAGKVRSKQGHRGTQGQEAKEAGKPNS